MADAAQETEQQPQQQQRRPHPFFVHLALIITQLSFGSAAVVGKFGVHGTNPALFALIREGVAGPILCAIAFWKTRQLLPNLRDGWKLVQAGWALFANQLFFIIGLKLTDPTTAAAWQPSQPITTLVLAVLLGFETLTLRKVSGILLAVAGAFVLVVLDDAAQKKSGSSELYLQLIGHSCFFINCLGTSLYVIRTKALLLTYNSVSVTGWAYMCGSLTMLVAVVCINSTPPLLRFICHDEDQKVQETCVDGAWQVPASMALPLVYWIFISSVLAYYCMTWANAYAKPSAVSAYTVLQPVASGLISALLFVIGGTVWANKYGFKLPGWADLGVLLILLGLAVLFSEPALATAGPTSEPELPHDELEHGASSSSKVAMLPASSVADSELQISSEGR